MPKLTDHQSAQTTKVLLIGDSGSGKTGAIASLAQAGYNIRVMDLDSGLDVLANLLRDGKSPYGPEALSRVSYVTLTDPMKLIAGKQVPARATVWQRAMGLLDNWKVIEKDKDGKDIVVEDFGPISSWTSQEVLVIDSLTFLSKAALNFILSMNARLGQRPHQSDWWEGQQLIEGLLEKLYDENVKCNVILICHIAYIGEENGPKKGYPASLGQALSPKIGRYFNTAILARATGQGANVSRKLLTNSTPLIDLKTSAPLWVKPEYDLKTGLAEIFKDLRGPK